MRVAKLLREFWRHGSNFALLLILAASLVAWVGGWVAFAPGFFLAGALLFYLTEYSTHRFLFHAAPSRFGWLRYFQHRLHYDHHVEPSRLDLLFLPLWYVLPILVVVGGAAFALLRSVPDLVGLVAGAVLALLHYEWVHFLAHVPYRPRTRYGQYIKKYHLWHHFKDEKLWFGVSNPVMDHVYGTFKDPEMTGRSGTTKILFPEK